MTGMTEPSELAVEVASEFLLTKLGNPGGRGTRNLYSLQVYWAASGRSYYLSGGIHGKKKFSADFQLLFRLLKLLLFIGSVGTLAILFAILDLTVGDRMGHSAYITSKCTAILVAEAFGLWGSVKALSRGYGYQMGIVIFVPVAVVAWFPFVLGSRRDRYQSGLQPSLPRASDLSYLGWRQEAKVMLA